MKIGWMTRVQLVCIAVMGVCWAGIAVTSCIAGYLRADPALVAYGLLALCLLPAFVWMLVDHVLSYHPED